MFELVRDDLFLVEQEIAEQNGSAIEPVREIGAYLRSGGGKRLASRSVAPSRPVPADTVVLSRFIWARWWR